MKYSKKEIKQALLWIKNSNAVNTTDWKLKKIIDTIEEYMDVNVYFGLTQKSIINDVFNILNY